MVKIRSHSIARLMINVTRWIISRLLLKLPQTMQTVEASSWRSTTRIFSRVYGEAQCRTGGENEGVDQGDRCVSPAAKRVALNGCNYVICRPSQMAG